MACVCQLISDLRHIWKDVRLIIYWLGFNAALCTNSLIVGGILLHGIGNLFGSIAASLVASVSQSSVAWMRERETLSRLSNTIFNEN